MLHIRNLEEGVELFKVLGSDIRVNIILLLLKEKEMNMNEIATAVRCHKQLLQIVMNNHVLGMVRQWQRLFYGKRFSQTTLDRPTDYMKLGEAFGIKSFVIDSEDKCEEILREALEVSKTAPVLIEARIDKDINVLPMVPAGKSLSLIHI